jgi:hypothetical protein
MAEMFGGKAMYVSGRFDGVQKEEVWARLLATGAVGTMSKSVAQAYLSADPRDAKLVATGKPIYTLADLPASLDGFLDRLKSAVDARRVERAQRKYRGYIAHLGYGPPADEALIAQIEQTLGSTLPAEVKSLMRQFDGLSCVVATLKTGKTVELPDAPLPYAGLADLNHPLWKGGIDWLIGTIAIPSWKDVFLRPQKDRLCDLNSSYAPKDVLQIGSLKVKSGELFPRLFAFDLFHHFGGAALYLDPKDDQAKIIYSFDHWADLTSAHPVSLRFYMESLAAGIWGRLVHVGQRPIRPVTKIGWPTYIRNIHGAPYVFIELK